MEKVHRKQLHSLLRECVVFHGLNNRWICGVLTSHGIFKRYFHILLFRFSYQRKTHSISEWFILIVSITECIYLTNIVPSQLHSIRIPLMSSITEASSQKLLLYGTNSQAGASTITTHLTCSNIGLTDTFST